MTFRQLLQVVVPVDPQGPSRVEACVRWLWSLICVNVVVLFFMPGGYDIVVGPLQLHASSLRNWFLLCFALSLSKAWLEERRGAKSGIEGLQSPLLLFIGAMTVYYSNGHTFESTNDTLPARFLPVSILLDYDFYLDEFSAAIDQYGDPYFVRRIDGHLVSAYPPWGAVLALPVYLVPVFMWGAKIDYSVLYDLEKRAAVLIMAVSVLILFSALRRLMGLRFAWFIAFIYAFGTNSLSLNSQALWQHGPSQLFFSLTLYCLVRGMETPVFIGWAGLALGWAVICRPLNLVMALPIALYVLHKHRSQCIGFILAGAPPFLLFLWYNAVHFGSPLRTGFGATVVTPASLVGHHLSWFNTPLPEGLSGVLFSPARGLFIYSPIFLLSLVGMAIVWKESGRLFLKYLSLAPLFLLIPVAMLGSWWGGPGYGPRLLADSAPFLCFLLGPAFEWVDQRPWPKFMAVGLAVFSISMHVIGLAWGDWISALIDYDRHPEEVWSWRDSPPVLIGTRLLEQMWQNIATRL